MAKLVLDRLNKKNAIGEEIENELKQSQNISILIISPYISDIEDLVKRNCAQNIHIICDAKSKSCNPNTLEKLITKKNIEIRTRGDIHAKVYIFDNYFFVTSANATPNGLGFGKIEAAVKVSDKSSVTQITDWFNHLWDDIETQNILDFSAQTWEELKSNWQINSKGPNSKPSLYDLVLAKKVPEYISFTFWCEVNNAPSKKKISEAVSDNTVIELPKNMDKWDYWMEGEFNKKNNEYNQEHKILERILKKYYNQIMINIKVNDWPFKKAYVRPVSKSRLLDSPITFKWYNKFHLLALYRMDETNLKFKTDNKFIKLINRSLVTNKDRWDAFFSTNEGRYGYCSTKKLYELVENCALDT